MGTDFTKDLEKHIRTVHLTLIFLCVAGIVVALAPGKTEISPARQQLEEIISLVEDWNPNFLQTALPNDDLERLPDALEIEVDGVRQRLRFLAAGPLSFVRANTPPPTKHWSTDCRIDTPDFRGGKGPLDPAKIRDVIARPKNIGEFKEIWNALYAGATLYEPGWFEPDGVFARRNGVGKEAMKQCRIESLKTTDKTVSTVRLRTQCLVPSTVTAINNAGGQTDVTSKDQPLVARYQFHVVSPPESFYFPVDVATLPVNAQAVLFRGRGQIWHQGLFDISFRELSVSCTVDREKLDWKQLYQRIAEDETQSPSEILEAFGIKIPARFSLYGALGLIIGVQWYLWVQLHERRIRSEGSSASPTIAWVGSYTSLPARALVVVSVVCAPLSAAVLLGVRSVKADHQHWLSWVVSGVGAILATALAWQTFACVIVRGSRAEPSEFCDR